MTQRDVRTFESSENIGDGDLPLPVRRPHVCTTGPFDARMCPAGTRKEECFSVPVRSLRGDGERQFFLRHLVIGASGNFSQPDWCDRIHPRRTNLRLYERADYEPTSLARSGRPGWVPWLQATGASRVVDLEWPAPNSGGEPAGYRIMRSTDKVNFKVLSSNTRSLERTYRDRGLSVGKDYWYRVAAVNSDGAGRESPEAQARQPVPLTARFTNLPEEHGGSGTEFTVRLRFSEPVKTSFRTLRDSALTAVNGSIRRVKRVSGKSPEREWRIVVAPSSNQTVKVTLTPPTEGCGHSGAICTVDGRRLSSRAEVKILPSGISDWLRKHGTK